MKDNASRHLANKNKELLKDGLTYLTGSVGSSILTLFSVGLAIQKMGIDGYGSAVIAITFYTAVLFFCNLEPWQTVIRFGMGDTDYINRNVVKASILIEGISAVLVMFFGLLSIFYLENNNLILISEVNYDQLTIVFLSAVFLMKGTALGILRIHRKIYFINTALFASSAIRLAVIAIFFDGTEEKLLLLWVVPDYLYSLILNYKSLSIHFTRSVLTDEKEVASLKETLFSALSFSSSIWVIKTSKGLFSKFGLLVLAGVSDPQVIGLYSLFERGLGVVKKGTNSFIKALYPIQYKLKIIDEENYRQFTSKNIGRLDSICILGFILFGFIVVILNLVNWSISEEIKYLVVMGGLTALLAVWMSFNQTTLVTLNYENKLAMFFTVHALSFLALLYGSGSVFGLYGVVATHAMAVLVVGVWSRFVVNKLLKDLSHVNA